MNRIKNLEESLSNEKSQKQKLQEDFRVLLLLFLKKFSKLVLLILYFCLKAITNGL